MFLNITTIHLLPIHLMNEKLTTFTNILQVRKIRKIKMLANKAICIVWYFRLLFPFIVYYAFTIMLNDEEI